MKDSKINERRYESRRNSPDDAIVKIRTEGKGLGILKTAIVGFFVLLELSFGMLVYLGFLTSFKWYKLVAIAVTLVCCVHVLSSDKPGHTKTVWVLFLTLFSSVGYIFYFLSLEDVFFGYSKHRYRKIFARTNKYVPEYCDLSECSEVVKRDADYLKNIGNFGAYTNTSLRYFPSGAQLFDDILDNLAAAKSFIFIEYFIIADGVLLNRFYDILSRKVQEGVDVRVIMDGMGSHGTLSYKARKRFKRAGIKLKGFNRMLPRFTFALNLRDHRKIVVVDGKTAYTGGCNLADEYINEKRMHGYWKDCGIKIEGEAVSAVTLTFLRQWEFVCRKEEDYSPYLISESAAGRAVVIPYADGKDYKHPIGKSVYSAIMAGANRKLYIMTPYFVPDEDTMNMLAQKALSGVDVRLVLPEVPDKFYVYRVTEDNAERLLKCGVKVYKMKHAFVHSKIVLSENCVSVGSVNIDLRSYYNQFENGVYTDDQHVIADILSDFESTFGASEEITEEKATRKNVFMRIFAGVMRLFSPLM